MSPLPSPTGRRLLELARQALWEAAVHGRLVTLPEPVGELARPAGAFVSLHRSGRLRGCVGWVEPVNPLAATVAYCTYAAAREDSRFPPVEPAEVDGITVEISVLSPLRRALIDEIDPLTHGLRLSLGGVQAVYLPQVARRYAWTRDRLLEEICRKAGLATDTWRDPAAALEIFTVEIIGQGAHPAESDQGFQTGEAREKMP